MSPLEQLLYDELVNHCSSAQINVCICGDVVSTFYEYDHHIAVRLAELVEANKRLVVPLPDPEDLTSKSRDFGRGVAHVLKVIE